MQHLNFDIGECFRTLVHGVLSGFHKGANSIYHNSKQEPSDPSWPRLFIIYSQRLSATILIRALQNGYWLDSTQSLSALLRNRLS